MIFGIPGELPTLKTPELRVALTPMGVHEVTAAGATVYIESGAGAGAGFSDEEYRRAGAAVVYSKEEAYRRADVVLKVHRPRPEEFDHVRPGQAMMGFVHLVTARKPFLDMVASKALTLLGYEIIQSEEGRLPIIVPMSEIAGALSVQIAARLLESPGGRGVLLADLPGIPPAEVVVLGAGTLGRTAARRFAGFGANVYVLDVERDRLERIRQETPGRINTLFATRDNIEKAVQFADVLVTAVLVPGKRTPVLVTRHMVAGMKRGAVAIVLDIDQGGSVETARISPTGDSVYTEEGVLHFCMPNAPTLVARTASHALTQALLPYLHAIARRGVDGALEADRDLRRGLYARGGRLTAEYAP